MHATTPIGSRTIRLLPTVSSNGNSCAICTYEPATIPGSPACAICEMKNGVPTSAVTVFAISSVWAWSASASRWMNFARSSTGVADHAGSAALAAAAAFVASSALPAATRPMTSSVVALITSMVPVPVEATHCPSM